MNKKYMSKKIKEIERKFLVQNIVENISDFSCDFIIQGYLSICNLNEVRVRKKGNRYFQTIKKGTGKVRFETEIEITKNQFDLLWPLTQGKRIEKKRYKMPYMGKVLEIDIFLGKLDGLIIVEVEFDSEKESLNFLKPS